MFRVVNTFFGKIATFVLTTTRISDNINVSNDTTGGDKMQKINQKRKKVHREYVFLRVCQKHEKYSDDYMAAYLGCSSRTYRDKLLGWNDFSPLEARALSSLFKRSQEFLFS